MADIPADGTTEIRAADGVPLKVALGRAQARARRRAFLLVLPLLAFVMITFVIPIGQMLHRSVHNPVFADNMPAVIAWFEANPPGTEPDEAAFAALASDLASAAAARTIGSVGTRVNYEMGGTRSLFTSAGRRAADLEPPFREALVELNPTWGERELWVTMRNVSSAYTANFYLAAIDRVRDIEGRIVPVGSDRAIYLMLFERTFVLSALITLICLALGFPIAHLLATLPLRYSNLLMILVLLPFWTNFLVRTYALITILQRDGLLNGLLQSLGVLAEPIQMLFTPSAVMVGLVYGYLPFMILPIYASVERLDMRFVEAAHDLGANDWRAFWRVIFPLTLPGVVAGCILVFIPAIGAFVTPDLMGGTRGLMIGNLIQSQFGGRGNIPLGSAISMVLLVVVFVGVLVYTRWGQQEEA